MTDEARKAANAYFIKQAVASPSKNPMPRHSWAYLETDFLAGVVWALTQSSEVKALVEALEKNVLLSKENNAKNVLTRYQDICKNSHCACAEALEKYEKALKGGW
jgi:hypothetical protein